MTTSDRTLAYAVLRLTLGINMLLHGAVRILGGVGGFADNLVGMFAETPLPGLLVRPFALALPFVEGVIGLLLILGLWTRWALVAGGLLMAVLVFGTALRGDWQTLGLQMVYAVIYYILLARVGDDGWSVDAWRRRSAGE